MWSSIIPRHSRSMLASLRARLQSLMLFGTLSWTKSFWRGWMERSVGFLIPMSARKVACCASIVRSSICMPRWLSTKEKSLLPKRLLSLRNFKCERWPSSLSRKMTSSSNLSNQKCLSLDQEKVERLPALEPWPNSWWGTSTKHQFRKMLDRHSLNLILKHVPTPNTSRTHTNSTSHRQSLTPPHLTPNKTSF